MVPAGERFARLPADPVPDLLTCWFVGVDDEMLADGLCDLVVNLEARRAVQHGTADESDEAAFLGDGRQADGVAVHGDVEVGLMLVPAQVLVEEGLEVEGLQGLPNGGNVNLHGLSSPVPMWGARQRCTRSGNHTAGNALSGGPATSGRRSSPAVWAGRHSGIGRRSDAVPRP